MSFGIIILSIWIKTNIFSHTHTGRHRCTHRGSASVHPWPASRPSSGRFRRSSRWSAPLSARDLPCFLAASALCCQCAGWVVNWSKSYSKRIIETRGHMDGVQQRLLNRDAVHSVLCLSFSDTGSDFYFKTRLKLRTFLCMYRSTSFWRQRTSWRRTEIIGSK